MKKKLLLAFIGLVSIFNAKAVTIVPTTSTPGNDVWYMIKCNPRDPASPLATWLSVLPNDSLIYSNYSGGDEQLWKVVANSNGAGGVALVNKKYGYLNSDARSITGKPRQRLSTQATMPTTPLVLVPSTGYPSLTWPGWDTTTPGVFIVSNSASLTVSATNTFTVNTFDDAFTLAIYSPASGAYLLVVTNPSWAGNLNSVVLFRTQSEVRAEIKVSLFTSITKATALYNNTSVGLNPGQFSADTRNGLLSTIEYYQGLYDDANSTVDNIVTATIDLNTIVSLFTSEVILPETSISTENWYYIRGTRYANTYLTAGAVGSLAPPTNLALIPDDTQLWKLVPNTNGTANGFAIVNKATGEFIDTDQARIMNMISTMPINNLTVIPHTTYMNNYLLFRIENSIGSTPALRIHSDADSKAIVNWTGDANTTCDWLFVSYEEIFRTQFADAITKARAQYAASVEGDEFGQFRTAKRSAFNTIIMAEEAKDIANMSKDDLIAATEVLVNASTAYKCNSDMSTLSTVTTIKWFRIINAQSPAGYATGKAMTSTGRTADYVGDGSGTDLYKGKYTYLAKDIASDDQLFRFELNVDETKAITLVNKSTGKYVAANGSIVSTPTLDNEFEITSLDNLTFWIKPTTAAPLHAAAYNIEIVNWNAGIGSASAWMLEYVKSETNTADLKPAFAAALTQARNYFNITSGGTDYGQYPVTSRNSLNTIISTEEAKTASSLTNQELADGINALKNALTLYKTTLNSTPDSNRWYTLESVKTAGKFLNVDPATNVITCETKSSSDNQKFRFVSKPSSGIYTNLNEISSKSLPTGSIRCENEAWDINYNTGTVFSGGSTAIGLGYWPWNVTLAFGANGTQSLLQSLDGDGVGTNDGAAVINIIQSYDGASAWRIVLADGESAIKDPSTNATINISIKNRIIAVTGSNAPVKVFTISGIALDATKELYPGVYIVKVNNVVKKVIIK